MSSDEYCPNCDNHFVLNAKTPQAALKVESEDTRIDARYVDSCLRNGSGSANMCSMIKDDRVKQKEYMSIFDVEESADRLG